MFYKSNYHSAMAGAPTINGVVGAGIGWLDTMLLTGFNVKSITTLERTDTTATATTSTAHGFIVDDIVGIYGVVESGWNGLVKILSVPDTTHFTFTVADTLSATTTGTITCKYPPLGSYLDSGNLTTYWTKTLAGTNKAIYRSLDPSGTQWYLRVDDTLAKYMVVTMLEGYSTIDTGLVNTGYTNWGKSYTADSTARPWQFVGDSKRFYPAVLWTTNATQVNSNAYDWYFFGDILTAKPGDSYHCGIIGTTTYPILSSSSEQGSATYSGFGRCNSSTTEAYLIRKYDQLGTQVGMGRWGMTNTAFMGYSGGYTHPNPSNAGTFIDQQLVVVETSSIRGKMPGMYAPISNIQHNLANRDKSIIVNGRQYMYFRLYAGNNNPGGFFLDVTPDVPWSL